MKTSKIEVLVTTVTLLIAVGIVSLVVHLVTNVSIEGIGEEIQSIEQKFNKGYEK